jgi:hypothetical protein
MRKPEKYSYIENGHVAGDAIEFMRRNANPDGSMGFMAEPGTATWRLWLRYFDTKGMQKQSAFMRATASSGKAYMVPCQNPREFDPSWGMSKASLQSVGEKLERYRKRQHRSSSQARQNAVQKLRGTQLAGEAYAGGYLLGLYEFVRDTGDLPDADELGFIKRDAAKVTELLKAPADSIRSAAEAIKERRAVVARALLDIEPEEPVVEASAGQPLTFAPAQEARDEARRSAEASAAGRWMQEVMSEVKDDATLTERVFTMLEQAPEIEAEATQREMASEGAGSLYVMGLLLEIAA